MNYYERHLGDYAKDTVHLSQAEHGAYNLLIDRYYATEVGIPADSIYRIGKANTKAEKAAVDFVLAEFFSLQDGLWVKNRIQEEITKAQNKIKAAHENGKRGGRPRNNQKQTEVKPSGFSIGSENETQEKAHQTPDTRHHKKQRSKAYAIAARLPPDWNPSEQDIEFLKSERPDLQLPTVAARFRDYWIAQPGVKGRKLDWPAVWRNWVRNEKRHGVNGTGYESAKDRARRETNEALTGKKSHDEHRTIDIN